MYSWQQKNVKQGIVMLYEVITPQPGLLGRVSIDHDKVFTTIYTWLTACSANMLGGFTCQDLM